MDQNKNDRFAAEPCVSIQLFQCSLCNKVIPERSPVHLRNDQFFCSMRCRNFGSVEPCESDREPQKKIEASAVGGLLQGVVVISRKVANAVMHRVMSAALCHEDVHGSDCSTMQPDCLEWGSYSTFLTCSSRVERDGSSAHCSWSDCSLQHQDSLAAMAVPQPLWHSKQRKSSIQLFSPEEICVATEVGPSFGEDMLVNLQY